MFFPRSLVWLVALAILASAFTPCEPAQDTHRPAHAHEVVADRGHAGCSEHMDEPAAPRFLVIAACPCGCGSRSAPAPLVSSQGYMVPASEVELASQEPTEAAPAPLVANPPATPPRAVDHVPKRA